MIELTKKDIIHTEKYFIASKVALFFDLKVIFLLNIKLLSVPERKDILLEFDADKSNEEINKL